MNTIYTVSYTHYSPEALLALTEELDAIVIDVRLSPRSRQPQYNGKRLAAALGNRYIHVQGFGNVNYKNGGPIDFFNLAAGEAIALPILRRQSIMLTCVCADVNKCHRKNIAEHLACVTGLRVEHLGKPLKTDAKAPPSASIKQLLFMF